MAQMKTEPNEVIWTCKQLRKTDTPRDYATVSFENNWEGYDELRLRRRSALLASCLRVIVMSDESSLVVSVTCIIYSDESWVGKKRLMTFDR